LIAVANRVQNQHMNQPEKPDERRRFQRFAFEGTVKLYSDKAMWESKLADI